MKDNNSNSNTNNNSNNSNSKDIREKYQDFCDTHINGSYERFKEFIKDYEVDDSSDEYRILLFNQLQKIYDSKN